MNFKQCLLILGIVALISAFCIAPGFATKKTTGKIYFKDSSYPVVKKVGSKEQDVIHLWYCSKKHNHMKVDGGGTGYQTGITMNSPYSDPSKYHLVSAKITFVKKVNGKTSYSTKNFKTGKWEVIGYNAKNGYRPYYAVVTYRY